MSLLGGALSGILGLGSDKKKNKRADAEMALAQKYADKQISLADYIQGLSQQLVGRGSGITMPDGTVIGYDAASGTYKAPLSAEQQAQQAASDHEEGQRLTVDQEMRRRALGDYEENRQQASGEAKQGLRDLSLFRQGVGQVNPEQIASSLRSSRTGAVNAGYDDAARAASMLGARTGSASVTDALAALGRNRSNAIAQTVGTPDVEGLQISDELNKSRLGQKVGTYSMFKDGADKFYDAPFVPSDASDEAYNRAVAGQQLDLSRFNTAMGGSGTAAAGVGSAANTSRAGYLAAEANRVHAPTANFVSGLDSLFSGGSSGGGLNFGSLASLFGG